MCLHDERCVLLSMNEALHIASAAADVGRSESAPVPCQDGNAMCARAVEMLVRRALRSKDLHFAWMFNDFN